MIQKICVTKYVKGNDAATNLYCGVSTIEYAQDYVAALGCENVRTWEICMEYSSYSNSDILTYLLILSVMF